MTQITERVGEALIELLKMEWQCPIYAVAVAANGSMLGCQYDFNDGQGNLNCKVLTESYDPSGAFTLPINVMLTDSKGAAARVVINGTDDKFEVLN